MGQLREIVDQINIGQEAFNERLKDIGKAKVKLLEVKQFNKTRVELKGYFIQISLKLRYKGHRIATPLDVVAYAGIYLTGRALKWFKPYLIEYQTNRPTTTNLEIKYIFINQENFKNRLIQMFGDPNNNNNNRVETVYTNVKRISTGLYNDVLNIYNKN